MSAYPTPPSSSGDSPQPVYFVASPGSNNFSGPDLFPLKAEIVLDNMHLYGSSHDKKPFLKFIEQPTNKFRFRYRSEMAGTHGSLCGMNSDKSRKQTYPTVELVNCTEKAVIRCSIYQHNIHEDFKPHPHRLIMKRGREEYDDPHNLTVGPEEGYVATFHSMGIIHTARKNIISELFRKNSLLKRELIARMEGKCRELTNKEILEIKTLAETESKAINLNRATLRFDAFIVKNDIWSPICEPLYSHGINNLKCALTGDLKIVRMDHCTSPAKGGKEIFVLVERVTKKNIKIRFFELDDEENEVWEAWGRFTELDVHHQYAIVFKTPEYDRNRNIKSPVRVYMELVRPSDNAKSEWKEFTYVPNYEFKPGAKRPRSSLYSSSSYNSSSLSSGELPATIQNLGNIGSGNTFQEVNSWGNCPAGGILNEEQMNMAMKDIDSDEFNTLFSMFGGVYGEELISNVRDSPLEISGRLNDCHLDNKGLDLSSRGAKTVSKMRTYSRKIHKEPTVIKAEVSAEEVAQATRTYNELRSFIKTKDAQVRGGDMLQHYLSEAGKTNALHIFIGLNKKEEVKFFIGLIYYFKKFELVNVSNSESLTPLHIAVGCCNDELVTYLMRCEADPCRTDRSGRTALHLAIESMSSPKTLETLLSTKHCSKLLEEPNYDGDAPIFTAIEKKNLVALKVLCVKGANVNRKHGKNGFTPLRVAVENQYISALAYLLGLPQLNIHEQDDFQNVSPLMAANAKDSKDIVELFSKVMMEKGLIIDMKQEVEEDSEEDMDEDEVEIKVEPDIVCPDDLADLYKNVTNLTPQCLDAVALLLDQSRKYEHLADLLDLAHLIQSGVTPADQSKSKNLLVYAIECDNANILDIRNFLENLDEHTAVQIMDQMALDQKK
ncbi:nuclear factor NF-kappa-B p110 subunit isoform X2 [Cylas formicarius]|nr:nuclear factor NF-kappa-B p110 subunit isoform X2 [Cylas formicarius]XP_060525556.1 nuclear factor NF-kappa-B p110 subunit isoform X2 [Cylas formicarius]XP_060525557.1 nuclear factor NF-kappa-B p110 subunit isoform X2 [Cylas formicarius]